MKKNKIIKQHPHLITSGRRLKQNYNLIRLSDFHINILSVCLSGEYIQELNRRKKLGQTVGNTGETLLMFLAIGQNIINIRELAFKWGCFYPFQGHSETASYPRMYQSCLSSKIYIILHVYQTK